jgi:hypothetical protein
MCLAKNKSKEGNLSEIADPEGQAFPDPKSRSNYIYEYYKDLFTIKGEKNRDLEGAIEQFLGPEIANHPIVLNSKLTQEEKDSLESDFCIRELDEIERDLNVKSAGGLDGINNGSIKNSGNGLEHHCATMLIFVRKRVN